MEKKRTDELKRKIRSGENLSDVEKEFFVTLLNENYRDKRGRLFRTISEVSASMLSSGHWSDSVNDCFRMLSETLNLSGALFCRFIPELDASGPLIEVTDTLFEKGSQPGLQKITFDDLTPAQVHNLKSALSENRSFLVDEQSEPGSLPGKVHATLSKNPILILPVMVRERVTAMVLLEKRVGESKWDLEEITSLESLTAQLSGIMEKHEMKQLLESAYQQAGIGTWEMRLDTGEVYWSPVTREIMGVGPDEVITFEMAEQFFISSPDLEKVMEAIRESAGNSSVYDFELQIRRRDGTIKWIRDTGQAEAEGGQLVRLYGTIQDIDERKRTEEQLRETEQKLRDVVENSTNLFYKHTPDHTLTYISPQSEHFFACSAEEAMIDWTEFLTDHPGNMEGIKNTEKAIETGERHPPFEIEIKRMDGKKLWVEVNEAPITEKGETVAIVGSLTDITDRKNVEKKLRKSLSEKETLLAEIHHRVKNNLAVVASMLQIQAIGTTNSELNAELLESVLRIKSMATIHEHLYKTHDFSEINFAENVKSIIGSVINTMQYETEISVNFDYDEVYLKMIQAVPASLIINEVATNIIKHGFTGMESGEIDVKIEQQNGHTKVRVIDNGVGLPDDFNPENSTTLGLQLIRTLTDQLNGDYNYPERKRGCEFCLEFDTKIDIAAED